MIVRARPLLGTLVSIQVHAPAHEAQAAAAVDEAWAVMARIARVMSAHDSQSDLARMSRAVAGQSLTLDPHTMVVLQAARQWQQASAGAFDPVRCAVALVRRGARPGLQIAAGPMAGLEAVEPVSPTQVRMGAAVALDFGGIAKGYAVDQAIAVLQRHGVQDAIVNAGGDIRVLGQRGFAVDVRHAGRGVRDLRRLAVRRLRDGAMATSVARVDGSDFVPTARGRHAAWRSATVMAADCMTADVLTKWALQASLLCPRLRAAMRSHRARMWRS